MCNPDSGFQRRVFDRNAFCIPAGALTVGLTVAVFSAWAGSSMRRGVDLISVGDLQEEVIAKWGPPYSRSGAYWLYRKGNTVYRLQFNKKGEVQRLKAEIHF